MAAHDGGFPTPLPELSNSGCRPGKAGGSPPFTLENAGPDIELKGAGPWTIWAWINAADDHGIQISGVETNDKLKIDFISGIGYFAGGSGWWRALSIAIEVAGGLVNPMSKIAAKGLEEVNKTVPKDEKASKPRDGYSGNLDGGGTATEEGGIIICLPAAGGPTYAKTIKRPDNGGKKKGCFFPTRNGREITIAEGGVLSVVAFDSNYADNAGRYEVKLCIERPSSKGGVTPMQRIATAVLVIALAGCSTDDDGTTINPIEPTPVTPTQRSCLSELQFWGPHWRDLSQVAGAWGWFVFDVQITNTCSGTPDAIRRVANMSGSLYDPHGRRVDERHYTQVIYPGDTRWICANSVEPNGASCFLEPDQVEKTSGSYEVRYAWRECDPVRDSCLRDYPPFP